MMLWGTAQGDVTFCRMSCLMVRMLLQATAAQLQHDLSNPQQHMKMARVGIEIVDFPDAASTADASHLRIHVLHLY